MDDSELKALPQDHTSLSGKVSCRSLSGCIAFCRGRKLDLNSLFRNLPFTLEHLEDPGNFIDWQSFRSFCDSLVTHFSEYEIRQAGRYSWQNESMNVYRLMSSLDHSLVGYYSLGFGAQGFIAKLFPCELEIRNTAEQQIEITLTMKERLQPCRSFHLFLAGQLSGMSEIYGYDPAKVDISETNQGAKFIVTYPHISPTLHKAKELMRSVSTAKLSTQALRNLNDALIEKCRQLRNESDNFRRVNLSKRKLEQKYQLVVDNLSEVIWTADFDLNLDFVSPSIIGLTGYTEAEAKDISLRGLLTSRSYLEMTTLVYTMKTEQIELISPVKFQVQVIHKKGSIIWIDGELNLYVDGHQQPQYIVGVARSTTRRVNRPALDQTRDKSKDLKTDRRNVNQKDNNDPKNLPHSQFGRTQKLEILGQLVGGISHDINNMLSGILNYSELALSSAQIPASIKRCLTEIESTSHMALGLTGQLMSFLRNEEVAFNKVDMTTILKDMQSLLQISIPSGISLRFNYTQAMAFIDGNRVQIEQMILNLALNARDALSDGGSLTISLYVRETAGKRNPLTQKNTARCVVLSVADTGSGMTNEVQEKIFTPYYTTKPEGSGTGLGMPQVLQTVKSHQGSINVESHPNVGTRIEIDFPSPL